MTGKQAISKRSKGQSQLAMSVENGHKPISKSLYELASVTKKRNQSDEDIMIETQRIEHRNKEIQGDSIYARSSRRFKNADSTSQNAVNSIQFPSDRLQGTNLFGTVLNQFAFSFDNSSEVSSILHDDFGLIPNLLDAFNNASPSKPRTSNQTTCEPSVIEFTHIMWRDLWQKLRSVGWHWKFKTLGGNGNLYMKPGFSKETCVHGVSSFSSPDEISEYFMKNPLERVELLKSGNEFAYQRAGNQSEPTDLCSVFVAASAAQATTSPLTVAAIVAVPLTFDDVIAGVGSDKVIEDSSALNGVSKSVNSSSDDIGSQIMIVVDNSAISFHKTITFASSEHSFAFLNEEQRESFIRDNVELNDFFDIATSYNDERELLRKKLYMSFMLKVNELIRSHKNILITYEDWSNCFNVIFTHILKGIF